MAADMDKRADSIYQDMKHRDSKTGRNPSVYSTFNNIFFPLTVKVNSISVYFTIQTCRAKLCAFSSALLTGCTWNTRAANM